MISFEISFEHLDGLHKATLRPALLLLHRVTLLHVPCRYAYNNSVDLNSSQGTTNRAEREWPYYREANFKPLAVEIGIVAEFSPLELSGDSRL